MKVKLINVGRGKVNTYVEVKDEVELLGEVSKHLASSEVELVPITGKGMYAVIVGGFRPVGKVQVL